MRKTSTVAYLAVLLTAAACVENEPAEPNVAKPTQRIIGSWVIDAAAQREEVSRVSPGELEGFEEAFRTSFSSIRETFRRDGRYEVSSPLGGPFDDRWELVSEDATAQREEVARISPSELEDFDEIFRKSFFSIRETFHRDGRYEVTSPLGGPFDDRWELVSEDAKTVTVRSSGHSWVARRATMGAKTHQRSDSVLTYTFSDPDHMAVTTRIPLFGEEKEVSYFFVRGE
jgi:hypothetical protein